MPTPTQTSDVWGKALLHFYTKYGERPSWRGKQVQEDMLVYLEREETGSLKPWGLWVDFQDYEHWVFTVDKSGLLRVPLGRVLDVGCGVGSKALELQNRGATVTAVDISSGAIEVARMRGVQDARIMDMHDIENAFQRNSFDAVVFFGNSLGEGAYSLPDAISVLRQGFELLKRDGKMVISGFYFTTPLVTSQTRWRIHYPTLDIVSDWFGFTHLTKEGVRVPLMDFFEQLTAPDAIYWLGVVGK